MEYQQELKLIKKKYGEEMMHFCRVHFPGILETPGILLKILEDNIAQTKMLIKDIKRENLEDRFENFIYSFFDIKENKIKTNRTPEELLKSVGYTLYECKSEEDIQKFKKYYSEGEKLCTFSGGRLNKCYVFFAIKNDAEKIDRRDFDKPEREDLYGTSVLSIQFSKGKNNTISIKNRYNHTVNNPDATYSNNLENIVEGLTFAFENKYRLNINQNNDEYSDFLTEKLNYVRANNNKFYRYNMELNNVYYCENNIIIDNGELFDKCSKQKERYILMDYFVLDLKAKTIKLCDPFLNDSFCDEINPIIDKIYVQKDGYNKKIIIKTSVGQDIIIVIDKEGNIIEYENKIIEVINSHFLIGNKKINKIFIPNVKIIGNNFLRHNTDLTEIIIPKVVKIGDFFLADNRKIENADIESVKEVGNWFLYHNELLSFLNIHNVKKIGSGFMYYNNVLKEIELPLVEEIKNCFLYFNKKITEVKFPMIEKIGDEFLVSNEMLNNIFAPKLKYIGNGFLKENIQLEKISLPEVISIGESFIYNNQKINTICLPKVQSIASCFLFYNKKIKSIYMPEVKYISNSFLSSNISLKDVYMPKLTNLDKYNLLSFNLEARNKVKKYYLNNNPQLTRKQKRLIKK